MMLDSWVVDIDIKVIIALISIVGILITAILSSAGYFYRNRFESKKSARKVLYLLLEIRHAINVSLFDVDEVTDQYIEYFVKRLQSKGMLVKKEEIEGTLFEMIRSHINNINSAIKTDISTRLLPQFEDTLMELASVAPVLAYQLRGKEKIEALVDLTNTYLERIDSELIPTVTEDWMKNLLVDISKQQKKDALKDMSASLDTDVILLAKHCGRSDVSKCRKALKSGASNKLDFQDLDKVIDKIIDKLIVAASAQNPK
ncbi:hypothetical protein [Shewanella sp. AC34-MNA-CIBAN-0136]|uniref:hypothetical protein n=1 Tax=Shewanella sp. AC34-MNA-CIBAN-0136 TaxID=3140463 RepID=UPI00333462FF